MTPRRFASGMLALSLTLEPPQATLSATKSASTAGNKRHRRRPRPVQGTNVFPAWIVLLLLGARMEVLHEVQVTGRMALFGEGHCDLRVVLNAMANHVKGHLPQGISLLPAIP